MLEEFQRVIAVFDLALNQGEILLLKIPQKQDVFYCIGGGMVDGLKEEQHPLLIVAAGANVAQLSVILPLVFLEEIRDVQNRTVQKPPLHEAEQDKQSANASVAVQEGVDRFKLVVDQGRTDKRSIGVLGIDVLLQIRHGLLHILDIGRDIAGIL